VKELRCSFCHKLLFTYYEAGTFKLYNFIGIVEQNEDYVLMDFKCPKCKLINTVKATYIPNTYKIKEMALT
jgi:phage FluMu protein Com